jgi:uncharacterized protein (DUF305 family)
VLLGLAVAWLVGALGYFIGVRTSEPAFGSVDRGFVVDMSDHHDQAILLAQHELENGSDPVALDFAREVLLLQRSELGEMAMLMAQNGVARPDLSLERPTMGWMGMSSTLGTMPGWVAADDVEALRTASGTEADLLFLRLMQQHHAGGAHMSEYAAEQADSPELRALAARMARNQRIEIGEYQTVIDRLDASS